MGVDLSETAVRLARQNLATHGQRGTVIVGDGAALPFGDKSQDVVYAHGVLQYAPDPRRIVEEALRVLAPGGTAIFMVYNRVSWLHALSKLMKVDLEHEDAPVLAPVFDPRVPRPDSRLRADDARAGTISGQVTPAQGVEGRRVQRRCSSERSTPSRGRWSGASAGT